VKAVITVKGLKPTFLKEDYSMCRRLIYLIFLVLVPSMVSSTSAGLVGHWKLDEGSGTIAYDSSSNENHGTLHGPIWRPSDGQIGGALEFDGTDDYVEVPDDKSFDITKEITVTAWINPVDVADWRTIISKFAHTPAWRKDLYWLLYGGNIGVSLAGPSGIGGNDWIPNVPIESGTWAHVALSYDGVAMKMYKNGINAATNSISGNLLLGDSASNESFYIGQNTEWGEFFDGLIDDVYVYDRTLTPGQVQGLFNGIPPTFTEAFNPNPPDGALHADTWITLSWSPGDLAVSHDVYLGDNLDDVNNGSRNSDVFRGNQTSAYYVAGFPGFAYPDGLVPGTTYYWRIDEVNAAEPDSPWKGPIWNFSIPPKKAYNPVPADGAKAVAVDVKLIWTPGFGAKLHTVYFSTNFDTVRNAVGGIPQGLATYSPTGLKLAQTYYWRVDEFDGAATHKGDVWSFTTRGAVGNPNPADGAVDVSPTAILTWTAGAIAASHEVYFGADPQAVAGATKASPEYKGPKALGDESYAPGTLKLLTAYYWRIDEVNNVNPDSPWKGNVWSFTTGDFFVVDDFEGYDAADNQIWYSWHDGLGYGTPTAPPYFAGNGTGAAVGDENTASFTEETIVHSGGQSMPLSYDNNKQGFAKYSEAELKLTAPRDWTAEGVAELSIWFRGLPASVGSFTEAPAGTYTMTASGTDIWDVGTAGNYHDEFHFAYKTLTGAGSIVARIQSVQNTDGWAKAGVMIRETLDGGSKHAFAAITPSNGVASQGRDTTGAASFNTNQTGVAAPYWVKLERDAAGNFTVTHSANGTAWQPVTGATPRNIPMSATVYVGLAVTSHDAALTCQAVFTNVTTTGTVSPQWAHQDIGIASNAAEPLYVAVSNSAGSPAVVVHPDAAAAQITTWTEWVVPLPALANQGITLTNVDRIAIGLGTRGNMTTPGGSGKMYIDDIRLYSPRTP